MKRDLKTLNLPLILLVALNLVPNYGLRPWLFMALASVFVLYRFWIEWEARMMPPRFVLWIIQGVLPILIWQQYQSLFGDEAAGTWLILLMCLKLFELRNKKDYFVTAGLCFFSLMSTLLLSQSLALSFFLLLDVFLIVVFMYALQEERWLWSRWRQMAWRPVALFVRILPLVVLIFILFPRFSTGFGTPGQAVGKTGVTDQLRPGSIAKLTPSDELIFRATFLDGIIPPRQSLYWRGAVLDQSAGLEWSRSSLDRPNRAPPAQEKQDEIEIYMEPGWEKFLFTLESTRAVYLPNDVFNMRLATRDGGIFEFTTPIQTRERYFLEAGNNQLYVAPVDGEYLQTPKEPSAKLKAFLRSVKKETDAETVAALSGTLGNGEYSYSLTPPQVDDLDMFLFETKIGFCEHYAGSTATILRYLNIPARVVVGFQGGTPSFLENYISVRAYDAHAWVEYYDRASKRWRRFDPTASVAPNRLTLGSEVIGSRQWVPGWVPRDWVTTYLRGRAFMDEVDAAWISFLVRFDLARQRELLAKLGMEGVLFRALPVFLILAVALVMAVLYFLEAQGREALPPEEQLYRRLVRALKAFKVEKALNEGPLTLMSRIENHDANLARKAQPILAALIGARFGREALSAEEIRKLRKAINSLTP